MVKIFGRMSVILLPVVNLSRHLRLIFVWQPLEDLLESGGELSKITLLRSHIYALQLSLLT